MERSSRRYLRKVAPASPSGSASERFDGVSCSSLPGGRRDGGRGASSCPDGGVRGLDANPQQ
eukprot:6404919-Prymnesium_polylepis.1